MIASLEKYKGFYIGRYELTANGEKTGATQTCENGVNWYTLYKNCTTLASGTKAKGLVISDNVADKELDKGKENVRRDLAGNQWVWVPVETPSSLYTTVDAGIALRGSTGVKTTKYTNSEIISGIKRGLPGSMEFREPDILTNPSFDYAYYATAGFSSLANMKK